MLALVIGAGLAAWILERSLSHLRRWSEPCTDTRGGRTTHERSAGIVRYFLERRLKLCQVKLRILERYIKRVPCLFEQVPGQASPRLYGLGPLVVAHALGGNGSRSVCIFSEKLAVSVL